MDKREFKNKVYTRLAKLVKAMANPHRLEIIDLLGQSERSVEDIANETALSIANASQHLQILKRSGLVQMKRRGNFILYSLANDNVYKSWKDLRAIGMQNFDDVNKIVRDFRARRNSTESVYIDELDLPVDSSRILFVDVRPEKEYKAGHIPNAVNIPYNELRNQLGFFKKSKQYIVYCRGPFCVFADDAVYLLTQKGFKIKRLEEGYPDWKLKFPLKDAS